jgi:hypothetical protein
MSDIEPRRSPSPSRQKRADRAYNLVLATGGLAVLAVALVILAVLGIVSLGWAVMVAVLAAVAGLLLRRTLNP